MYEQPKKLIGSAQLYLVCAKANFKLGYFILTESLLLKCFSAETRNEHNMINEAHFLLGQLYVQ